MKFLKSGDRVSHKFGLMLILMSLAAWCVVSTGAASAQNLTTLHTFSGGTDGGSPWAGLVADANGDLFGTTTGSPGAIYWGWSPGSDYGTVFEIPKTGTGYGTLTTLVTFDGSNGAVPYDSLYIDSSGNLFGTTMGGGTMTLPDGSTGYAAGTVFEIPYNSSTGEYASSPTTLVTFNWDGSQGEYPVGGVTEDSNRNLIGTTAGDLSDYLDDCDSDQGCGPIPLGTVFEIPYNSSTGEYASSPTTLATFNWDNGAFPLAGILIYNGNLFGTTYMGGTTGGGTVFEIKADSSNTETGYGTLQTLYAFVGNSNDDGTAPWGGLTADANGDLFGTASFGGPLPDGSTGYGTVFEIPYDSTAGTYATSPTYLATFDETNGFMPMSNLLIDAEGNIYGTTYWGGSTYSDDSSAGDGTVFEIVKDSGTGTGYADSPTPLVNFNGSNGESPMAGLIADASGNIYGTTSGDWMNALENSGTITNHGTVFEITGSGFISPTSFAGTPGKANCSGVTTSTLAHTFGGIAHAAKSLGYSSVDALQTVIHSYCGQ